MKRVMTIAVTILSSVTAYCGDVFYWRVDHVTDRTNIRGAGASYFDWADFGDSSNWSLDPETYSNPNGRVPGSDDLLYTLGWMRSSAGSSWTMGYFDLGDESWTVAGFSTNGCPGSSFLYRKNIMALTNGTLTVTNPAYIEKVAHSYLIFSGATLIYPSGEKVVVSHASPYEDWTIKSGGRIEAKCGISLTYLKCIIESGGTFLWDPDSFDMTAVIVAGMGSSITNSGTLLAPHGILWNGSNRSGSASKVKEFEVAQMAGEMHMGGNFTKTTQEYYNRTSMRFVLGGGTLYAESDVAFTNSISLWGDEVSASMPDAASATVDVASGATLDMRIFTYGAGSALTKTGSGTLLVSDLPSTLSVTAGKVRFAQALVSPSGLSFASGTVFEFGATGNSLEPFSGYANVSFALAPGVFGIGSAVLASSDAAFLAHVASSITDTLPADTEAVVSDGVLRLTAKSVAEFSSSGVASLADAAAWGGTVPVGEDIYVTGASTVARIDSATPAFNSITVIGGATLEVTGTVSVLPPVTIMYPATLRFAENSAMTCSVWSVTGSGDANGLPVLEIATNAVVSVPVGTGFKNVHLRLFGEIGVPDMADPRPGLSFGTADAGETAYFAMTAIGGKIRIAGSAGVACRNFMKPADSTGRVVPVGELLLKDVTFPPHPDTAVYIGNDIGVYNPRNVPFTIVLDNTVLPFSQTTRIFGASHIKCINGGGLRSPHRHPGVASILQVRQYSKVTLDGPESSIVYPYSNAGSLLMDSYVGGSDVLEILNGAWVATHGTSATTPNGVVSVSNGTWRIAQLPYVPADNKPAPPDGDARNWFMRPFSNLQSVRIAPNSTLWMQSSSDLQGTEWDRDLVVADVPITGAGDLVVTNGTLGYGLSLTFVNGANTDTGHISVAPSADPTHLYFADGANWAGTVVSDGRVSLTNLADAAAAATVSFGSIEFAGDFPIRVWKRAGIYVADQVNLSRPVSGTGGFLPVPDGFRFEAGDTFTIGTWAAAAVPADGSVGMAKKWRLVSSPSGTEGFVTVSARYTPPGTLFLMR